MIRLGLTGGIGSGKSTVAAMLQELGAGLVDADAISRSVTSTGGAAIEPIRLAFGPAYIDPSGALDRARMRDLAYRDLEARKRLEGIIHPLVGKQTVECVAAHRAAGCRLLVHDIPLLAESGRWRRELDLILVVDCPPALQTERVRQRSGLDVGQVQAIIAAQSPRALRLRAADAVVCNVSGIAELRDHVLQLHQRLMEPGLKSTLTAQLAPDR